MKKKTNTDKIRAMTDEELAEILMEGFCPNGYEPCAENCKACWVKYLQKPVDGIALEEILSKNEIELWEAENE